MSLISQGPSRDTTALPRIPTASAPDAAAMESVAAGTLERMQDPTTAATRQTIVTQFGTTIDLTKDDSGTTFSWPNYWIHYTGMRAETCAAILGALTGPIRVRILAEGDGLTASWATADTDHRVDALTAAGGVQSFCELIVTTDETIRVGGIVPRLKVGLIIPLGLGYTNPRGKPIISHPRLLCDGGLF